MGHFKLKILFFLLIISGITGKAIGQNINSIQRVKAIEPFIKAEEVNIHQDRDYNLWITTPVKVMRYNSIEVKDYNKFRGVPREIGNSFIATQTDSENKTWLAGNNGVAIFHPEKDEFQMVSSITGEVYAMREDSGKQLWIAAENGIFKLNVDSDKRDFGISRFLSENTLASAIVMFNNNVVFAGPNGILSIDRRSGKVNKMELGYYQNLHITSALPLDEYIIFGNKAGGLYKTDANLKNLQKIYSVPHALSNAEVTSLQKFDDEIIVSTNGSGIFRLNKDLKEISASSTTYPQNIYSTYLNEQNLLWVVAKQGLYLQNFSTFGINKLKNDPAIYSSLADDFVTAEERDSKGNIWFGTGEGLSIWNPETNRWRHIKNLNYNRHLKTPDKITDLAATGEHIWVATANDGVYKMNIQSLLRAHYSTDALYKTKIQSATTIFEDARENIWIGGEDAPLTMIKPDNEIKTYPIKDVQAISELGPKQLILATKSRVHSLNPYNGRITDLDSLNAKEDQLYYAINDLKITNEGVGLFATEGAGLLIYDFQTEELNVLNEDSGLPSNNITGIEGDLVEGFWIATNKGLVYYESGNKSLKVYSELNGLTTNELTTGFAKLKDGSFVVGSTKGVNVFKPRTMLAQQELIPDWNLNVFCCLRKK